MPQTPLPRGKAMEARLAFVRAFVTRYGKHIDEREIWNEPNHTRHKVPVNEFAAFHVRTAEAVRAVQPAAGLYASAFCQTGGGYVGPFLTELRKRGKLGLVNAITYHPYSFNPDSVFGGVEGLRRAVAKFSKDIAIFQGENGCPSTKFTYGVLSGGNGTELSKAKWALRRLLGDLGHDIRSSCFGICDMHYVRDGRARMNAKGLIATEPDKTVDHLRLSYRAVQNLTAVFDSSPRRVAHPTLKVSGDEQAARRIAGYVYRREPPARRESETLRRLPNSEKSATPAPGRRNRPRMPLGRFGRTPVRPRVRSWLRRPFRRRLGIETKHGRDEGQRRSPEPVARAPGPGAGGRRNSRRRGRGRGRTVAGSL